MPGCSRQHQAHLNPSPTNRPHSYLTCLGYACAHDIVTHRVRALQAERVLHTVLLRRAASAEAAPADRGSPDVAQHAAGHEQVDPAPPHPAVPDFVQVRSLHSLRYTPVSAQRRVSAGQGMHHNTSACFIPDCPAHAAIAAMAATWQFGPGKTSIKKRQNFRLGLLRLIASCLLQPAAPATPPRHRSASAPAMAASPLSKTTSIGSEEVAESAMVKVGSTLWAAEGPAGASAAEQQSQTAAGGEEAGQAEETASGAAKGMASSAGQAMRSAAAAAARGAEGAAHSAASTAAAVTRSVEDAAEAAAGKVAAATSGVHQALQGAAAKAAEEVQQAVSEVSTLPGGSSSQPKTGWCCTE